MSGKFRLIQWKRFLRVVLSITFLRKLYRLLRKTYIKRLVLAIALSLYYESLSDGYRTSHYLSELPNTAFQTWQGRIASVPPLLRVLFPRLLLSTGRRQRINTNARPTAVSRASSAGLIFFVLLFCFQYFNGKRHPVVVVDLPSVDYVGTVVQSLYALTGTPVPTSSKDDETLVTFTPAPLFTPSPTLSSGIGDWVVPFTPTPSNRYTYLLSFYDPDIGVLYPDMADVNCADWDEVNKVCLSPLSNGADHREWYWRSLACAYYYPLGTMFRVYSPDWLAGDWLCLDYGDMISPNGEYLDFLIPVRDILAMYQGDLNNFPWSTPVIAEVILK